MPNAEIESALSDSEPSEQLQFLSFSMLMGRQPKKASCLRSTCKRKKLPSVPSRLEKLICVLERQRKPQDIEPQICAWRLTHSVFIMVYYIRFLKTPKLTNGTVRALVTITTDLGDSFYPGNLTIYALVSQSSTQDLPLWESEWHVIQWRSGNRNVWIDVKGIPYQKVRRFQLIVGSKKTKEGDNVFFNDLSEVMSARSGQFGGEDIQADDMVERLYRTGSGHERSLYEESGESIARHIW